MAMSPDLLRLAALFAVPDANLAPRRRQVD
jgi:hypothetical protein